MSTEFSQRQYLLGPIALLATVLVYNLSATRLGGPTISSSIRWIARKNIGSWATGAVIGGLLAHWFLESGETYGA